MILSFKADQQRSGRVFTEPLARAYPWALLERAAALPPLLATARRFSFDMAAKPTFLFPVFALLLLAFI